MKRAFLFAVIISALIPAFTVATPFEGNLILSSQDDVDNAAIYTSVTGSLVVSGADITDLTPLSSLESVGTYISLRDNPALVMVGNGFDALTEVGGGIYFYDNNNLVTVSGFDALLWTGDNIDFWFNDNLDSVSGFASLQTAGWSLEFGGNPRLRNIPEFISLQTINSSLFILDNPNLAEITGFRALQYVDWSFQIQGNTSLDNLCGFFDYFSSNNPYTGNGAFDIVNNGPALPDPTTEQDVIDAGHCAVIALEDLRGLVVSLDLTRGIKKQLSSKLDTALTALDCGISCGASYASTELEEFKSTVERQRGKKLTDADVNQLIVEADTVIRLLVL